MDRKFVELNNKRSNNPLGERRRRNTDGARFMRQTRHNIRRRKRNAGSEKFINEGKCF